MTPISKSCPKVLKGSRCSGYATASTTHHDLKTDTPQTGMIKVKASLDISHPLEFHLYLSSRPVVLDRGRGLSMLPVPRLHALEDLAKLIPDLAKLMVDLVAQGLMFLFKAANLFLQSINALGVNLLRHGATRGRTFGRGHIPTLGRLALSLPFGGKPLYHTGVSRISNVLSLTRTENFVTVGAFSKDNVQAQIPARRNDLVGIQGTFVA